MSQRVVVGLSGGVDSSVAAYLLKQQGYEVVGLFMKNWDDTVGSLSGDCPWKQDRLDAMKVAAKLGIAFHTVDFVEEYRERVVEYMFREYKQGRTPNPDILCNREIKFDVFFAKAMEFDADFVATGHYVKKAEKSEVRVQSSEINKVEHCLLAGKDEKKDQSYFLCQLSQDQLAKSLFPIGDLEKSEVRKIAKEQGFITADKKDSQGICFVGKVDLPKFLQQRLAVKPGNIVQIPKDFYGESLRNASDLSLSERSLEELKALCDPYVYTPDDGDIVGRHNGAHFFTIGQRKGLSVGGTKAPLFVIGTDVKTNTVYVGEGEDFYGLYRRGLKIKKADVHWVREMKSVICDLKSEIKKFSQESIVYYQFDVRVRYRQSLQKAWLFEDGEFMYIVFEKRQRAIAPGQFAAWYHGDELIGSGVIWG